MSSVCSEVHQNLKIAVEQYHSCFLCRKGRILLRPSRDWRKSHQCALLMGGNGRDAILCVRNRSQIGRRSVAIKCDPPVGGSAGRLAPPCAKCAHRSWVGASGDARPTVGGSAGRLAIPWAIGARCSSVGASGNACAVSIEHVPTTRAMTRTRRSRPTPST